ncbi:MAG: DNA-binding response regulator [Pyrinomonas sp.]|uniref:response regulator transcription factor n=1 Tax=Pyrinomonas sp. TaxID=2080306 RepID=UPI0033195F59
MKATTNNPKNRSEAESRKDATERRTTVLLIEDDENITDALSEYFKRAGYEVKAATDGVAGVQMALQERPDAVILDLMLPKMDGLAVCRELREKAPYIPILMLTAKDDVVDKVLGLEMGADDYITKPFSFRELEARLKSVLRRVRSAAHAAEDDEAPIVRGKLRIDPVKREVTVGDRQVELTPKEFELLKLFASHPGRVFPRKYLLEKIWDYAYDGYDRTIDSHINRLRAKIEENPEKPQMVLTVWGIGYKFNDEFC